MKTRQQKDEFWKVEPLPADGLRNIPDLTASELAALLADAYRRIVALEAELGRAVA